MIEKFLACFESAYLSYSASMNEKCMHKDILMGQAFGCIDALALFFDLDSDVLLKVVQYIYCEHKTEILFCFNGYDQYKMIMDIYYEISY